MIDFTGKLNNHIQYIEILEILEKCTAYIEITLIDGKETNSLIEWWGTKTSAKNKQIRIKASEELFEYLKQFETFCKYYNSEEKGDYSVITDFGYDDIAFLNEDNDVLLCTTTHEGYIAINEKLL